MSGEVIDVAFVEVHAKIDPGFGSDVRRAVQQAIKPVAKDVDRALAPVRDAVRDGIEDPMHDAADSVRNSMRDVSRNISAGVRNVRRDLSQWSRQIEQIEGSLRELRAEAARRISVDVNADTSDVDEQIRELEASLLRVQRARSDIDIDVDIDDATRQIDSLLGRLRNLGGPGGRGPIDGLRDAFDGADGGIGRFVTGALRGVGALGSLAASAAVLKPAILAAAAAIAVPLVGAVGLASASLFSLGGVLASLGVAFGAVKIASLGVGDALKAQSKAQQELAATGEVSEATQQALDAAMKDLAPAARQVVRALAEVQAQFSRTRKELQQSLFAGQAENIRALADTLLPGLGSSLLVVTKTVNGLADQFTKFVTAGDGARQIKAIVDGLAQTFRALAPAFGNIGAGLLNLFEAGLGPARSLSESIVAVTERFRAFTESITSGDQFTDFLTRASNAAGELFGFLGILGKVLVQVFGAGASTGVGFLGKMSEALGSVADAIDTVAGKAALGEFFEAIGTGAKSIADISTTLAPALAGILTAIQPAITAAAKLVTGAFNTLLPAIQPAIDGLTPLFATLASALKALQPTIAALGEALGADVAIAAQGIFDALQPLLPVIGQLASIIGGVLVVALNALAPVLSVVASVLGVVGQVLASVIDFFQDNAAAAIALGVALIALNAQTIAATAATVAYAAISRGLMVVQRAQAAVQWALNAAMSANPIGLVVAAIAALVAGLVIAYQRSETFRKIVNAVGNALKTAFLVTVKAVGTAIKAVVGFIGSAIKNFDKWKQVLLLLLGPIGAIILAFKNWDKIKAILATVAKFLLSSFVKAFNALKPIVSAGIEAVLGFFKSLPGKIVAGLGNLASLLGNLFLDAMKFVGTAVLNGILNLVQLFATLPLRIAGAVGDIGGAIVTKMLAAFGAIRAVVVAGLQALVAYWLALPGRIVTALATLSSAIGTVFRNLFNTVRNLVVSGIQANVQFWAALPGRIVSALRSLAGSVVGVFNSLFNAVRGVVSSGISNIVQGFQSLVSRIRSVGTAIFGAAKSLGGKIIDGIVAGLKATGSIATKLADGLRSAINSVLPDRIGVDLPAILGGGNVGINIPQLANGGIFNRATLGVFGEAGKEAIIPVTRAVRAAQLVAQSGLADIPEVQRVVLDRLRLDIDQTTSRSLAGLPQAKGPVRAATLSDGARSVLSRSVSSRPAVASTVTTNNGPTRTTVKNVTQNNTIVMPPVSDPDVLAESFLARIADDSER